MTQGHPTPTVRVLVARLDGQGVAEAPTLADAVASAWAQPATAITLDGGPPAVTPITVHTTRHWAEAQALLTRAESDRAARFRDFRDRQAYVFAHALLRAALAHELCMSAAKSEFTAGAHGKPRLQGEDAQAHFNLSYRRSAVAVAIGTAPVGVDVEWIRPGIDMLGIAGRFFTPEEQAFLQAPPPGELAQRFFGLWTRKEALLKAAGLGVDFMPTAGALNRTATLTEETGMVKPYCVHQLDTIGNHAMALAVEWPSL
jgi:4'-phosphopantetheinyl transferase